jgi:hypothetical protein
MLIPGANSAVTAVGPAYQARLNPLCIIVEPVSNKVVDCARGRG